MHTGLLGEMADSKIGEGTIQDEPGAHRSVIKWENIKQNKQQQNTMRRYVKRT